MTGTGRRFLSTRPYPPDPFQVEAVDALEAGNSVLVTAPTGAGKTLVAEAAIHLARTAGRRAFYTAPIKALSNQKFSDLRDEYGRDQVGLLTGDNVINGDAPIVVMTTEVLRNMIYADASVLDDVEFVVLDEVHYLQDRFRGPVWEEVIIHAPAHVRLVCLSATVSNADEFAGWIRERRGPTTLVVSRERPVPLDGMYLMADRAGEERVRMFPTFVERDGRRRPNAKLEHLLGLERGRRHRFSTPRRLEVVETLRDEGMLPAIVFVFSRAGCDAAARTMVEAGVRLVEPGAARTIRETAEQRTAHLGDRDLEALDYRTWVAGLEVGVAAHHAGLVPAFKETVEELFAAGLLKVVFATETLALGINMPARTVVLESLSKFDGEGHAMLEPGDYTQLTGRAGRRGIDTRGYGVVLHSRYVAFDQVVRIASSGSHPLRSSFRPTYNMAANLVANYRQEDAERLLSASFAQYQRQESSSKTVATLEAMEERLADELALATCERGSVAEYAALADAVRATDAGSLAGRLQPGDVIDVPAGPRAGRFVVLRRLQRGKNGLRFLVMGTSGRTSTISRREIVGGSARLGMIDLPGPFRANDRRFQATTTRRLRAFRGEAVPSPETATTRRVDHPVASCPDAGRHLAAHRRAVRAERRIEQMRTLLRQQGFGLVEEFEEIQRLLEDWGYLDGWALTPAGERLRFVYNESDLLLAEALDRGLFWDLDPAELAALASCFVFEPRTDEPSNPRWPTARLEDRHRGLVELGATLNEAERRHRLPVTRRLDPGFVANAHAWASGAELEDLPTEGMAAGDFVRVSRQLVDLIRQIRDVMPELASTARDSLAAIDRGVVAARGIA